MPFFGVNTKMLSEIGKHLLFFNRETHEKHKKQDLNTKGYSHLLKMN